MHTKSICSKFSADERCQIDSPRDSVSLYTQNRYSTVRKFVPLPKCLTIHNLCNSLHTTEPFASPLKMSKILLVFIIRENKTWTLLLASVGTEFEASAHLKMFIFVLNGSFVICELCCSVCKSAKSICTWCESAFLLNSMSLQQKK